MDADPAYASQIVAKLQEWKGDYDRWDNTVATGFGYNVAEYQAGKSYVFDLDKTEMCATVRSRAAGGSPVPWKRNCASSRQSRQRSE